MLSILQGPRGGRATQPLQRPRRLRLRAAGRRRSERCVRVAHQVLYVCTAPYLGTPDSGPMPAVFASDLCQRIWRSGRQVTEPTLSREPGKCAYASLTAGKEHAYTQVHFGGPSGTSCRRSRSIAPPNGDDPPLDLGFQPYAVVRILLNLEKMVLAGRILEDRTHTRDPGVLPVL